MDVDDVLRWLRRHGSQRNREGMARYGIASPKVFGVSMTTMRPLVKKLGRDHELAQRLWATGWLEARILAGFVDEPAKVTPGQMEQWAEDFDNWAVCDSTCLHLFDRTPHAWRKVRDWSRRRPEFVRRAAFATLAGLAVHDRHAPDNAFIESLRYIANAARDDRPYVKKGASWALRQIGKRNRALNIAAVGLARTLASDADSASARWVGADALRELTSAAVQARLRNREAKESRAQGLRPKKVGAGRRRSGRRQFRNRTDTSG
jgi:3-methyladenine DNA glycosylase AlkD